MADDDEEDREFTRDALQNAHLANAMRFVVDGQDLMDYLRREGRYADGSVEAPRPGVILLDLNMPKKDGREALAEIKADENLRSIPVIVLTTSKDEEDVFRTYDLGVNSFITKPVTFTGLVEVMRNWQRYWFELVELPNGPIPMKMDDSGPVTVLLVEDDEDDYLITRDLLRQQNRTRFVVDWCSDFDSAMAVIGEERHGVYLIDYRLGAHTGLDLVRSGFAGRAGGAGDHADRPDRLRDRPRGDDDRRHGLPLEAGAQPALARAVDPLRHQPPSGPRSWHDARGLCVGGPRRQ